MKLIDLTCPNCSATLQANPELTKCFCLYCGKEILIDDEKKKVNLDNGFDFGYQAELGRQKALQDIESAKQQAEIEKRKAEFARQQQIARVQTENAKNANKGCCTIIFVWLFLIIIVLTQCAKKIDEHDKKLEERDRLKAIEATATPTPYEETEEEKERREKAREAGRKAAEKLNNWMEQ